AKRRWRDDEASTAFVRGIAQGRADRRVCRHAAGNHEHRLRLGQRRRKPPQRRTRTRSDDVRGRALETGADISDVLRAERGYGLGGEPHRRLEAGEREIEPVFAQQRPGKVEAAWIARASLQL